MARNVKCELNKTYDGLGYVKADGQSGLVSVHRQLFWVVGGVPMGVVRVLQDLAMKGGRGWYASRNRNRQLNFKSDSVFVRILPVSRRCEVLSRIRDRKLVDVRGDLVAILEQSLSGLLSVDYDAAYIASQMASRLVPSDRHRRFLISPVPFWEVKHYQSTLGLVIKRDHSEKAGALEVEESTPPWVSQLIDAIVALSSQVADLLLAMLELRSLQERNRLRPEAPETSLNASQRD
jgi:hypothetical protein